MNRASESILNHPLHKQLGIKLVELDENSVQTEFIIQSENASISNTLHGGVLYLLSDVTCAILAFSRLSEDEIVVSHSVNFNLMSTAKAGATVRLYASIEKFGRSLVFLKVEAFELQADASLKKIASGNLVKSRIAKK